MNMNLKCPQCGSMLEMDDGCESVFCQFCGAKVINPTLNSNAAPVGMGVPQPNAAPVGMGVPQPNAAPVGMNVSQPSSDGDGFNLIINYTSINPRVLMITRIASTGQKSVYMSGQTMKYKLPPGKHIIVLKIGKINYNRAIYIPDDNKPVKIDASFMGRADIQIDQPPYTIEAPVVAQRIPQPRPAAPVRPARPAAPIADAKPRSQMSVFAFVLSFLFVTSPIALILGIVDITAMNDGSKNHKLSVPAIAIGASFSFLLLLILMFAI